MKRSIARSVLSVAVLLAGAALASDASAQPTGEPLRYQLTRLDSLGGSSSVGSSINDRGWIAGRSNRSTGLRRAALWRDGEVEDLGALGGPDKPSAVLWPVKNLRGIISGIAYSDEPDPSGERWSCGFFLASPGTRCFGFRWEDGVMTALRPFEGGNHSFATGTNNAGLTVGWAETGVVDPAGCVAPQRQQFHAVVWGPGGGIVRDLPPLPGTGDTVSAATAINDRGQVVGISGICDQAVGRLSAIHNVLWENGQPTNIGDFGGVAWNTPMMINQHGDIVGFANASQADGSNLNGRAFLKLAGQPIRNLGMLDGDANSSAASINAWRQVVGDSCDAADNCRAFLWQNDVMMDLNSLVDDDEDVLTIAKDIDDFGRITGQGFDNEAGKFFAFVATPIRR
jgi:probable HAF family extracellular repeat protein